MDLLGISYSEQDNFNQANLINCQEICIGTNFFLMAWCKGGWKSTSKANNKRFVDKVIDWNPTIDAQELKHGITS